MMLAARELHTLKVGDFFDFVPRDHGPEALPMPKWWALARVDLNREMTIAGMMIGRGVANYLPTFPKIRVFHGRRREQLRMLFPGVLFIPDFQMEARHRVLAVPGVIDFVRFGEPIGRLMADGMSEIRRIEQYLRTPRSERGELRRITSGAFFGYEGKIDDLDDKGRLALLIHYMGRQVRVHLTDQQVEAV